MTSYELIGRSIRGLVRSVMGMPADSVRPANSNAPVGAKDTPMATVLVSTVRSIGADTNRLSNVIPNVKGDTVKSEMIGNRLASASIQFFGASAFDNATALVARLQRQSAVETMRNVGLGFVRASPVTNVSAVINTYWEERSQVQIDFTVVSLDSETLDTFGIIPIQITQEINEIESSTSTEVYEP